MRRKLIQQLIFFVATLLAFTGGFAQQRVMPDHQFPGVWQRIYKENDYVQSIVLGEKRIWGDDPVAIVIDRGNQELLDKKMPAKACAFFSGKCISGTYIICATESPPCDRLAAPTFYYRNGKSMQIRQSSSPPQKRSIPEDMPTSSESVSNEDSFERAAREFSNYQQDAINHELTLLIHDNPKMTWDANHYWPGRPDLPLPSMFSEGCEPLSATVSLWNGGGLVWSKTFGRNFNKDIDPWGNRYRDCAAAYMTSGVGEFLIIGGSLFVTTAHENGFVLRFRIRDGYFGTTKGSLIVMDSEKVVAAKRALRSEYINLMKNNNIPEWMAIPTRDAFIKHKGAINYDYGKDNKVTEEIFKRRNRDGDPLSTERISKELLKSLSTN